MPRILGVDLPKNKKIKIALQYIYGIGSVNSLIILKNCNIDPERKASELTDEEISKIVTFTQNNYRTEGELRRETTQNIRRLVEIGCYRGTRHKKGLPVHGQRTKCNARTRKGPRPRVGGVKIKPKE
jgi:small subunit ribosomal protein S13